MCEAIEEEWDELQKDFNELESTNLIYLQKLNELTTYQQACIKQITHQRYRMKTINHNLKQMKNAEVDAGKKEEIQNAMLKREAKLQNIEETLPKQTGKYLKVILGNIDVSFLNKEAKFKYKDEYEKFKLVCNVTVLFLAIVNVMFYTRTLQLLQLFFLVWYYCTISIRESILTTNGSKIKTWWQFHHFLSTVASCILLVWPESEPWSQFRSQFMYYTMYSCFMQYLQFKYQRGVLYKLKALGKRDNMEITVEGFQSWMWKELTFLIPILLVGYLFQLVNSYVLYKLSLHPQASWHVTGLSVIFAVFFVGNTVTTVMVVPNKIKNKMFVQYRVMAQRLYDVVNENIAKLDLNHKEKS